jgi:hypothetical protein
LEALANLSHQLKPDKDLVTLGISCEACHLGGREHARNNEAIRFAPTSPFVRLLAKDPGRPVTGERENPGSSLGICAQCHCAKVAVYPNGAGVANSREALDLRGGACASQIRCVNCHEPHTAGPPSGGPTPGRSLQACLRCHPAYRDEWKALAHARHPLAAGVDCLDCHMPRYNQGVDGVVRTHHVAVPVEQSLASKGFANACNLCHLDKSVRWTLEELERGWKRRIKPGADWAAGYGGSLDRPAGGAWLTSAHPPMRLVATHAYARSPLGKSQLPEVIRVLNDPVPLNRAFALFATEGLLGRSLLPTEVDIAAPPAVRARQVESLRRAIESGAARRRHQQP